VGSNSEVLIAFDVAKKKRAVSIAEEGRAGEVRFLGDIENSPPTIKRTIKRLAGNNTSGCMCFEAGPTGYGLSRRPEGSRCT
jgi:transposase